jgi:hypothetical protein
MREHRWPTDLLRDVNDLYPWCPATPEASHDASHEETSDDDSYNDGQDDHLTHEREGATKPPILTVKTSTRDKQSMHVARPIAHTMRSSSSPRARRSLILCFDGTGNKFQGNMSDSNSRGGTFV